MKKYFYLILAAVCCAACQSVEENKVWPALEMSFEQTAYSQTLGESIPVSFTVTGVDGALTVVTAEFQNEDWSAECYLNEQTGKGLLYVTAPDYVGSTSAVIKVVDEENERSVEETLSFSSTPQGLDPISVSFAPGEYVLKAGEGELVLSWYVSALGEGVLVQPAISDIATTLTVAALTYDPVAANGTVTVTAPETAKGGTVTVAIQVKDGFGRVASGNVEVTVEAAPAPEQPDQPDTPQDPATPAAGLSNCYIVAPGQSISFAKKFDDVTSVSLAWQDANKLVKSMNVDGDNVVVAVSEVAGNALVLGKDASGKTLWSWHIWVTDFDPEATAVTIDGVTFMDRNLGAVNALPGDVGAVGQAYQWGRKDPMPRITERADASNNGKGTGSCSIYDASGNPVSYLSGDTYYKSYQASNVAASVEKAEYFAIRDPNTNAWFTKDVTDFKDLWGGETGKKSEYDPCPQGWKVPVISGGTNPFAFMGNKDGFGEGVTYDVANFGHMYTKSESEKLWFPVTGQRSRSKGAVHNPYQEGNYWIGTYVKHEPPTSKGYEYIICAYGQFNMTNVSFSETLTSRPAYLATALAVRCVKE